MSEAEADQNRQATRAAEEPSPPGTRVARINYREQGG